MDYIHYMAEEINTYRNDGYIDERDLFYEDTEHESGSSQLHSDIVLREFDKLQTFVLPVPGIGPTIVRDNAGAHRVSSYSVYGNCLRRPGN